MFVFPIPYRRGGMHPLFERGRGRGRGRGFGSCLSRYNPPTRFCKEDYMDEFGNIDKKQLLEIATKNATKLAMVKIFYSIYVQIYFLYFRKENFQRELNYSILLRINLSTNSFVSLWFRW
jgi:hypothetical protein